MKNYELKVVDGEIVGMPFIYGYFALVFILGVLWVYRSELKYKFEAFVIVFYMMTGNLNDILTFAIPGVSAFEIQPDRFLLLMFSVFLFRRAFYSKEKIIPKNAWTIPWFMVMLILYCLFKSISLFSHVDTIKLSEIIIKSLHVVNILLIIFCLRLIYTPELIKIFEKAIIVGAITTSIASLIQMGYDPMFVRMGDIRIAFGDVYRVNGIFNAEYYSSYFLIIAATWVLLKFKNERKKIGLVILFSLGIFMTFHRMSWALYLLIFGIYFLFYARPQWDKLLLAGTTGLTVLLFLFITFQREIVNSTLVKERVTEEVGSRFGYYSMVYENIEDKPILGFGNHNNEVYYYNMLHITRMPDRATGKTGGIHSGYLSAMFYYGIPAFIFFTLFVLSTIYYFGRLFLKTGNVFFLIIFFLSLIFGFANISNTLLFKESLGLQLAIYLGLGLGARYYDVPVETKQSIPEKVSVNQNLNIA